MKEVVKQKRHYIIAAALIVITLCVAFLPLYSQLYSWFGKEYDETKWWNPDFVVVFAVAIFFLIGFIWQDLHKVRYRRITKNWNGPVPDDIKEESWGRCYALFMASASLLIASINSLWVLGSFLYIWP